MRVAFHQTKDTLRLTFCVRPAPRFGPFVTSGCHVQTRLAHSLSIIFPLTVKRGRLALAGSAIGVALVAGIGLFVYSASRARVSKVGKHPMRYYIQLREFLREKFPPAETYTLEVTGPTGTPVIVGYRIDGSQSGILQGIIPTNCVIKARRRVEVAVKNMGTNFVRLGFQLHPLSSGAAGDGGSSWGDFPQFYGFSGEYHLNPHQSGGGSSHVLTPTNWPVTLPLGMTQQEAKTKDFDRELTYLRLKDTETRLEQNPTDPRLLAAAGSYYLKIDNRSAAEGIYQRFFATDCNDATFLNIVVYEYADNGRTNLDRAYDLAVKAQTLAEEGDRSQLPYINDTVAWIQVKRGYYREALEILNDIKALRFATDGVVDSQLLFHLGMAQSQLGQRKESEDSLRKAVDLGLKSAQIEEVKKALAAGGASREN